MDPSNEIGAVENDSSFYDQSEDQLYTKKPSPSTKNVLEDVAMSTESMHKLKRLGQLLKNP